MRKQSQCIFISLLLASSIFQGQLQAQVIMVNGENQVDRLCEEMKAVVSKYDDQSEISQAIVRKTTQKDTALVAATAVQSKLTALQTDIDGLTADLEELAALRSDVTNKRTAYEQEKAKLAQLINEASEIDRRVQQGHASSQDYARLQALRGTEGSPGEISNQRIAVDSAYNEYIQALQRATPSRYLAQYIRIKSQISAKNSQKRTQTGIFDRNMAKVAKLNAEIAELQTQLDGLIRFEFTLPAQCQ